MKKTLILLAGYPATGKTYLCNKILDVFPDFAVVSQDEMKEGLWDQYGFSNLEEKTTLENQAWGQYYDCLEKHMEQSNGIISDYPFSEKQKGKLNVISKKYQYQVITIRLVGDIDVLYERSRERDLKPDRHLAHLVSCYQKGDTMEDRSKADCLVTKEIFRERCENRGYDTFELGHLISLDVTDYHKINYSQIIEKIRSWM